MKEQVREAMDARAPEQKDDVLNYKIQHLFRTYCMPNTLHYTSDTWLNKTALIF